MMNWVVSILAVAIRNIHAIAITTHHAIPKTFVYVLALTNHLALVLTVNHVVVIANIVAVVKTIKFTTRLFIILVTVKCVVVNSNNHNSSTHVQNLIGVVHHVKHEKIVRHKVVVILTVATKIVARINGSHQK